MKMGLIYIVAIRISALHTGLEGRANSVFLRRLNFFYLRK